MRTQLSLYQIIVGLLLAAGLLLGAAAVWLAFTPRYALPADVEAQVQEMKSRQAQVERAILAEYHAGTYSLADPLVVQDPYGMAPLTALVVFDTPTPAQISLHLPGRVPEADVDHVLTSYLTHHQIPIYGLYAGQTNQLTITATTRQGESSQSTIEITTEALPTYLKSLEVLAVDRTRYSPGFNFSFLSHKEIYDIEGDIRWYSTLSSAQVYTRLANGHFLYTYDAGGEVDLLLMEQDLLGKVYAMYYVPKGVHHDVIELPNGNLLAASEDLQTDTVEDMLVEIDGQSGYTIRTIDLKDYLNPNRPNEINYLPADWLHLNSIYYDAEDPSLIVSGRAQSAVVKFSYPDMQIEWILGPHDNWEAAYQPYLLSPQGDDFEWQWSQHHATVISSDVANSLDLLLFDNGNYRSFNPSDALSLQDNYSRVVHYRIDEQALTVEQVWSYGKERGGALFSESRGSAYLLQNGNFLGDWASVTKDAQGSPAMELTDGGTIEARAIEVEPQTGEVIFEARILGDANYRMMRAGLYENEALLNNLFEVKINDTTAYDLSERLPLFAADVKHWQTQILLEAKRLARRLVNIFR